MISASASANNKEDKLSIQFYILAAYFILLILVGLYAKTKSKSSTDFILAGRNLGLLLCTATMLGEWLGAMSTIGTTERAYAVGFSPLWYNFATGTGMFIFAFTLASIYRKKKVHTVAEMIESVYNKTTRLYSAFAFIIAYIILAYVQVQGAGSLIASTMNIPICWGIIIAGIVITIYITLGGLWSISLTNLMHTILLYTMIIVVFITGYIKIGGYNGLFQLLTATKGAAVAKSYFSPFGIGFSQVFSWLIGGIMGVFASQASIQPVFAAKDWQTARKSSIFTALLIIPIGFLMSTIGMIAASGKFGAPPTAKQALPNLLMNSNFIHPILGGLAIAGILAAILSTIAPVMFAVSTIISKDIYQRFINPNVEDKKLLRMSQMFTLITGIAVIPLALTMKGFILDTAYISYAIRGVAAIIVLFGIYISSIRNARAATYTIIGGTIMALISTIFKSYIHIDKVYMALISGVSIYLIYVFISKLKANKKEAG